jgi:hypothetical protein
VIVKAGGMYGYHRALKSYETKEAPGSYVPSSGTDNPGLKSSTIISTIISPSNFSSSSYFSSLLVSLD